MDTVVKTCKAVLVSVTCSAGVLVQLLLVPGVAERLGVWEGVSLASLSEHYKVLISPYKYAFLIWVFIGLYQLLWLTYAFSTLFRRTRDGPLFYYPAFLPAAMFVTYLVTLGLHTAWLVTWHHQHVFLALVFLVLQALSLYICLGLCFWGLARYGALLSMLGCGADIGLVKALVQNGLAIYASWVTIISLVNLAIVMVYHYGMPQDSAGFISLTIMTFAYTGWTLLDKMILDKHTRHVITPYLVTPFALGSMLTNNWHESAQITDFTIILFMTCLAGLVVKICLVYKRGRKDASGQILI